MGWHRRVTPADRDRIVSLCGLMTVERAAEETGWSQRTIRRYWYPIAARVEMRQTKKRALKPLKEEARPAVCWKCGKPLKAGDFDIDRNGFTVDPVLCARCA